MAYIEKESLCAWLENMGVSAYIIETIKDEKHFPSADVVEVVRCKDCIHKTHSNKRIMCKKDAVKTGMGFYYGLIATEPNNFCSHGERREQ